VTGDSGRNGGPHLVRHGVFLAVPGRVNALHRRFVQNMACLDGGGPGASATTQLVQFGVLLGRFVIVHAGEHALKAITRKSLVECEEQRELRVVDMRTLRLAVL